MRPKSGGFGKLVIGAIAPALLSALIASFPGAATATPAAAAQDPMAARTTTVGDGQQQVIRDPLELRALLEPEQVLALLPAEIEQARKSDDAHRLALLYLAQANAYRVIADWAGQREAGKQAKLAARQSREPILQVRGLIAESRGAVSLKDYSDGEHLLGEAELILQSNPAPEFLADVYLAYSSLSTLLGKDDLAATYARKGLASLRPGEADPMRVRLLRNLARAQAQLGRGAEAKASLKQALALMDGFDDPKLRAELFVESARLARAERDIAAQEDSGQQILAMADRLKNSQLSGMGHEVLGIAALDAGQTAVAERELAQAWASFRDLGLGRDELRVLRQLLDSLVARDAGKDAVRPLVKRLLALDEQIERDEHAKASEDFDARLKYAASEVELVRLKDQATMAQERAVALQRSGRLTLALSALATAIVAVLAVFYWLQRRSNRRLQVALERGQESEYRYRMLADNSRDLVVRMRADGHRLYVSPSSREMLGWEPAELAEPRWELVHPDDRAELAATLSQLMAAGGTAKVIFRVAHKRGHYVWIEALARRVDGSDGAAPEIVYSGRDVSARVQAEQALAENQRFVRAITDHIPALISYVDADERYVFANALYRDVFGIAPEDMVGRKVRDVRDDPLYRTIAPHMAAALRGESASFEGASEIGGRVVHFQTDYVPDRDPEGRVRGFFALTRDITTLKLAEQELARQARHDSLTGIANRRQFEERLTVALARSKRHHAPMNLMYLDIDHFKQINDRLGHAVGDVVLQEFARRIRACVREEDLVARLGGDEFVVLVEDVSSPDIGELIARKLIKAMAQPIAAEGAQVQATCSIGIAFFWNTPSAEHLLAAGDAALYEAKSAGRNTYRMVERH